MQRHRQRTRSHPSRQEAGVHTLDLCFVSKSGVLVLGKAAGPDSRLVSTHSTCCRGPSDEIRVPRRSREKVIPNGVGDVCARGIPGCFRFSFC